MKMEAPAERRFFQINPTYWCDQFRQFYQPYQAHAVAAAGEIPSSSSKVGRHKKIKVTKICLLVSFVIALVGLLMLTGIGVGLHYAFKPDTTLMMLMWPYGPDAGDAAVFGVNTLQVDTASTGGFYIFGATCHDEDVFMSLVCQTAEVIIDAQDTFVDIFGSDVPDEFDNLDPTKGQFCYYRKTSSDEDKEKLCRLIGGDVFTLAKPYEAHVYTFTNYTYRGSPVGTFQMIIAMTNPKTYLIRSYEVINDIPGVTEQFSVITDDGFFEDATMATDVRGQTEVFDLTDAATEPNLNDATPSTASGCA